MPITDPISEDVPTIVEKDGIIARNSRWPLREGEPTIGDTIEGVSVGPRGAIEECVYADDWADYEGEPVTIEQHSESDDPWSWLPCGFCSPIGSVIERGVIWSDYDLVAEDGTRVMSACHSCVAGAEIVQEGER